MTILTKTTAVIALALATVTLSSPATAATSVNVSTGLGANGSIDSNWKLNGIDAFIPMLVNSNWNGGIANVAGANNAKWLTPSANGNESYDPNTDADYLYSTVFTLPNIVGLTSIAGTFWSDNQVQSILLNGVNILTAPSGTFNDPGTVFGSSLQSNFVSGTNTLAVTVRNFRGSGNPTGLKMSALVTAVPEPGTWLLMLMGFGFVGFQMRRRQKTQVRFQFA